MINLDLKLVKEVDNTEQAHFLRDFFFLLKFFFIMIAPVAVVCGITTAVEDADRLPLETTLLSVWMELMSKNK